MTRLIRWFVGGIVYGGTMHVTMSGATAVHWAVSDGSVAFFCPCERGVTTCPTPEVAP